MQEQSTSDIHDTSDGEGGSTESTHSGDNNQCRAHRGSLFLDSDDYKMHLANAVRLENVAVLLGAGTSKYLGGKVMRDIWQDIDPAHREWLVENGFAEDSDAMPNVEMIVDMVNMALIDAERRDQENSKLTEVRNIFKAKLIEAAMLKKEYWKCINNDLEMISKLHHHVSMLVRLVGNRQPGQIAPWIFTTNYDLSVEWASEALGLNYINGFSGLHYRSFRPSTFDLGLRNVMSRGQAQFGTYNIYLAKLHGSLSWMTNSGSNEVVEQPAFVVKHYIKQLKENPSSKKLPNMLILPGQQKYFQTVQYVYGEMFRRFSDLLSRPNTALFVCGYGFGDEHINRLISSGLQNPTLQLIIYPPRSRKEEKEAHQSSGESLKPAQSPQILEVLRNANLPQVTFCNVPATFEQFAVDLPEPAMIDDFSHRKSWLKKIFAGSSQQYQGEKK